MLEVLDSRALRRTDCYGQRFMKAGTYRYHIVSPQADLITDERPFAIEVVGNELTAHMQQHTVIVRRDGGRFKPDQENVKIRAGDLVLWNCPDSALPYMIAGDKEFFSSYRLTNECGYSHAFGTSGEFHWIDAFGSKVSGVVRVKNPDGKERADIERWRQTLAKGAIVVVTGDKAEPREIDIVMGQTVFFAVSKGPGISITDARLLRDSKR